MRWPSLTGRGPRRVPVVGPTEALRGWAGGPGADVPPGAVPGLLDHERQSGWQVAQRVWRDSGVDWEDAPETGQAAGQWDDEAPGPYAPDSYGADRYSADPYSADAYARPFAAETYGPDSYPADADALDAADLYPAGDLGPAHQFSATPHAAGQYLTDPNPTRPDLPVLREPADSLLEHGTVARTAAAGGAAAGTLRRRAARTSRNEGRAGSSAAAQAGPPARVRPVLAVRAILAVRAVPGIRVAPVARP